MNSLQTKNLCCDFDNEAETAQTLPNVKMGGGGAELVNFAMSLASSATPFAPLFLDAATLLGAALRSLNFW
ncbi:MAG: hypothetical protein ACRC46_05565 [Thermoguttaceae bacterium]